MARIARIMAEDWPFHLTHRGNHRKTVFRSDDDRLAYLGLLRRYATRFGMKIWAYCLMGNHVHLIGLGKERSSIAKALGNAHRDFSRRRNLADDVTGHLWANRFFSTALDEPHLWAAVRYVELNPVRGGLVRRPTDYPWSSARAHAGLAHDPVLEANRPFPGPIADWPAWLAIGVEEEAAKRLRRNTGTGRPTGCERFLREIEARLGRQVRPRARGPKSADLCE